MALDIDGIDLDGIRIVVEGRETFHEGEGAGQFALGGGWVTVEFWIDYAGLRITQLTVEVDTPRGDIDGQMLRSISIPATKDAILAWIHERLPIERRDAPNSVDWVKWRDQWPNGEKRDMLLSLVAAVYNRAIDGEQPPTQHVAKRFQVSRATAGRMVAAAREAGKNLRSPAPYPGKRKGTSNDGEDSTRDR